MVRNRLCFLSGAALLTFLLCVSPESADAYGNELIGADETQAISYVRKQGFSVTKNVTRSLMGDEVEMRTYRASTGKFSLLFKDDQVLATAFEPVDQYFEPLSDAGQCMLKYKKMQKTLANGSKLCVAYDTNQDEFALWIYMIEGDSIHLLLDGVGAPEESENYLMSYAMSAAERNAR